MADVPLQWGGVSELLMDMGDGTVARRVAAVPAGPGAGNTGPVTLLSNANATGAPTAALAGGRYVWKMLGTFGGTTVTLQSLGPDGSTYQNVTSLTAAGQAIVEVGVGEVLRASVSGGSPSGLFSTLSKVI